MNQEFTLIPITDNTNYYINTNGDIYSKKTNKVLKPISDTRGYYQIHICINKKQKTYSIHRLVGFTFIPNPENKREINHKNGIKTDNRLENLEWVTSKENTQHAFATGLKFGMKGEKNPMFGRTGSKSPMFGKTGVKHHNCKKVMCIETGEVFGSMICVQRKYGFDTSHIGRCCKGKIKSAYGYTWRYL